MKFVVCMFSSILLATAAIAQQAPMSTWMTHQVSINGNEGVALTDQQVATYSAQALRGSGAAANRLGEHFLLTINNRRLAEYWYLISAEDGDAGGQRGYGSMILEDSSENKTRAIFWLEKSASQGDAIARNSLQHIMHCPNLVASEPCS
ncbi:SEL1-like repeat protein [Rhodanobacter sp. C03]|uniref:SEL1-like repeat protein n=1 Tax=Rhodanobacter sp. C03 TaxID=1945858 RepID=UPI001115775B|nr:SEL1-like repeat protein [Rhodanobacter sp. C03]